MKARAGQTEIEIVQGDITEMETVAIVNAANAQLVLGAGVAGAIRKKGGPAIQEECDRIGGTYVGGAVVTGGGNLKARYVIHAVGPRMGEGDEDRKLREATLNSLKRADENKMASIALPAISTGIFGFPLDRAARIMLSAAAEHLAGPTTIEKVVFCLFGQEAYDVFTDELKRLFPEAR
ncbi:MAG: macro domain-containing protein [Thermodesulfobacteriota bacterium]